MIVYLVRHARAGHRAAWEDHDHLRPLDERGQRQADALVAQLAAHDVTRIASSPALRCIDTVRPLADARGVELEPTAALVEGAGPAAALALFRSANGPLVACVHGDLIEQLIGDSAKKGETLVLEVDDEGVAVVGRMKPQA
jgi:phosphohistidine phosphatase SixA